MTPTTTLRCRTRRSTRYLLDTLESRTLLSGDCLGLGGSHDHGSGDDGDGGEIDGGHHNGSGTGTPTPITDLTGTALTFNQIAGLGSAGAGHGHFRFSGQDIATITSASTPVKLCTYSVSIDWGDGSAPTRGFLVVDKTDPTLIHVKGFHTFAAAGDFTVTITVTQTLPAVQTGGTGTTGTVATTAAAKHGKALGLLKKHTVTTTTTTTSSLTIISTAHVTQNSDTGVDVVATTGQSFTGSVGTFTIPSTDTTTDPATFTALINWGDNSGHCGFSSSSLGTVTLNADGSYTVDGTHTYSLAGSYRISVVVFQTPPAAVTAASTGNNGLHLGWCHSVVATIFSTATVTDAPATGTA